MGATKNATTPGPTRPARPARAARPAKENPPEWVDPFDGTRRIGYISGPEHIGGIITFLPDGRVEVGDLGSGAVTDSAIRRRLSGNRGKKFDETEMADGRLVRRPFLLEDAILVEAYRLGALSRNVFSYDTLCRDAHHRLKARASMAVERSDIKSLRLLLEAMQEAAEFVQEQVASRDGDDHDRLIREAIATVAEKTKRAPTRREAHAAYRRLAGARKIPQEDWLETHSFRMALKRLGFGWLPRRKAHCATPTHSALYC